MPRPFVAYLRVYEPLSVLEQPLRAQVEQALGVGGTARNAVGDRERELWLRSQLAAPPRLLPADTVGAQPLDVLVLDPAEVALAEGAEIGPGPLVCPLDVRARSAAGLVGFVGTATLPLLDAALQQPADVVKARAAAALAEMPGGAAHVISATWSVPLPWFAMVEPEARHLVLAAPDDPDRMCCWRVGMTDARSRVAHAFTVVHNALGEESPAKVLRDTGRWLAHFHPRSVVELDYGGLVQLIDDDTLLADTSAQDVQAVIAALESGDAEEVAERYAELREFWDELVNREQHN
ncbi:hypothetical protein [Crossiella cryophila]|uniref:DUF8083 domain-containing protein n=1 Tax=Crossiella cryophila TaxID=43355 RepID=A0A7W7C7H6_9PSEU|nr:hypothetical protein [Crossiella cryophila]MBB4674658.1 hypothetical protein [Crossiella cryophila]